LRITTKEMNKTLKTWLESIADDSLREAALRNMHSYDGGVNSHKEAESLSEAIAIAFPWASTPEDVDFWSDIECKAHENLLATR
jgi:hypothetical protein